MSARIIKKCLVFFLFVSLTACNGFFEKDNTPPPNPLVPLKSEPLPELIWSTNTGSGPGKEYLKMGPALGRDAIFTTSPTGTVTAVSKIDGKILWQTQTYLPLVTTAGVGDSIIAVGSYRGDVVALDQTTGTILWRQTLPGEILAKPALGYGKVIVKTIDGYVRALSSTDGQELWAHQETEPNLILRGASAPIIRQNSILVGFANGALSKLTLSGRPIWTKMIATPEGAFAIQRMIDIDADPIMFDYHVYVATYQGQIASLDWISGKILWTHELSSYTGMAADKSLIYVSDARSHIWAFNTHNGFVNWRQVQLEFRGVTGPAITDDFVVVGDAEGYLHWISKLDGHIITRASLSSAIYGAPVSENNIIYALNNNGYLVAYRL